MKWLLVFLVSFIPVKEKEVINNYACSSYIVYDGLTDKVLEGNDVHNQRSVASISKIMTAIISIEYGMWDEYFTIGDWINKVDGSSVYLYVGEVIKVEELLYGLMLRSGNDCASSLAMFVSGNISSFVDLMNRKGKELGMNNTLFRNPSGLDADDGGNLSTAYDMALLNSYAMKNDKYREIVSTKEYKSSSHGVWINKNKLLRNYEYTIGGKTGYTKIAKRTLVTVAKKGDTELIVVTLNCGGDFSFHKSLYEYWFNKYKTYLVIDEGKSYIDNYVIYCDRKIYVSSIKDDKMVVNYHLIPLKDKMEISTSESDEIVGICQIKGKIDSKINKSDKNWFIKLIKRIFN